MTKRKIFQSPPLLSLALIGILLLSAVLYYRSVKIQRFLEPALAITTPRIEFSGNIKRLLIKEFGPGEIQGIRFTANSIFVERSLLAAGIHGKDSGSTPLYKLSRVLLSVLKDPDMKEYVDFVLVSLKSPVPPSGAVPGRGEKFKMQERAELILNSLYKMAPELEKSFRSSFAATVISGDFSKEESEWVEFRFIQTEMLHMEVLQSLKKYTK